MLTLKIVFALLCYVVLSYQVEMKIWDQAGEYTLMPEDYGYANNIMIQLWGAGSGSSYMYGGGNSQTGCQGNVYCGGNSGAYINININTVKQETFYFTLGGGGLSTICRIGYTLCQYCNGQPGNYSLFYSEDKNLFLNVSGAYQALNSGQTKFNASVTVLKYRADDIIINNINGTISNCYNDLSGHNYNSGAEASFGAKGGNINAIPKCSGYMGSGSGYQCNGCEADKKTGQCVTYYKGGDGALILYY